MKIKNALKALSTSAGPKPNSGGVGTAETNDGGGGSLSSDSRDGDENSLKVYATKITGLPDQARPVIHLQLSSPIESQTLTSLFDPLDLEKEGSITTFRGVETDMATLEFKVEDKNKELVDAGGTAMDKTDNRMIGSSAAYSVIPMCEIDFLGGGVKRKVTELNVAIVLDNDSAGTSSNKNDCDGTRATKSEDEKTNTKADGSEEKAADADVLDNEGQDVITEADENNVSTTESCKETDENDEMIVKSKVDGVKDITSDESIEKIDTSTDNDDVFLDARAREESIRLLTSDPEILSTKSDESTSDPEFLDSKSEEDAVFVASASVVEEEVANASTSDLNDVVPSLEEDGETSTHTTHEPPSTNVDDEDVANAFTSDPNDVVPSLEEDGENITDATHEPPLTNADDGQVENIHKIPTTATSTTTLKEEEEEKSSTSKKNEETNIIDAPTTHEPPSTNVDDVQVEDLHEIPTTATSTTTLKEEEGSLPYKENEETNINGALNTKMMKLPEGEETSIIIDVRDEEQSSSPTVTGSTPTKSSLATGLLLPTCTIDIHIEFNPSTKDEKNGLSDLLENASTKKAQAINRLRKAAEAINRVKQSTSETASTSMVTKPAGAVKSGFLNRPNKPSSTKKEPWRMVRWYMRVLGPQSLVRVAFPVAKNYLMFIGGLFLMHYQGYQLALPPPV